MHKYLDPELAKLHDLYDKHKLVSTGTYSSNWHIDRKTNTSIYVHGTIHHCPLCGMFYVRDYYIDPHGPTLMPLMGETLWPTGDYLKRHEANLREYAKYVGASVLEG